MTNWNRRKFIQVSAAAFFLNELRTKGASSPPAIISDSGKTVRVEGANYIWEWSPDTDRFRMMDKQGRELASSALQPAVVVQPVGQKGAARAVAGRLASHQVQGNRVICTYEAVNHSATLSVAWRFDEHGPWVEPVIYKSTAAEDVVSLHYFAEAEGEHVMPSLEVNNLVLPGISESSAISPIAPQDMGWNLTSWLGRGAPKGLSLEQQWGLPAHYFCGFRGHGVADSVGMPPSDTSGAFCCGLADLPNGDLFLTQLHRRASLALALRGDLWEHLRGPGQFTLGATLFWSFGPNLYEAIRQYYLGLIDAGIIKKKVNSARKNAAALAPQWCTWGEQVARHKDSGRLDEAALTVMYDEAEDLRLAGRYVLHRRQVGRHLRQSGTRRPALSALRAVSGPCARRRPSPGILGGLHALRRSRGPRPHARAHAASRRRPTLQAGQKYYLLDFTRPEVAAYCATAPGSSCGATSRTW